MNLTDEEIRIKVAEAMGLFRIEPLRRTTRKGNDDPNGVRLWYCSEHHGGAATYSEVPNYPEDLNACASFEATLTDKEWDVYSAEIVSLTLWDRATDTVKRILQATARQRCLAYLKTKGLIS